MYDPQSLPITGEFVRKRLLKTSEGGVFGLAVSPDGAHMVVSHGNHTLSVYALPGGEHIRTFGSLGEGKGILMAQPSCASVSLVTFSWLSRATSVCKK